MKTTRAKKVLGIAIGDSALLAAELMCAPGDGNARPDIRHLATLEYSETVSLSSPTALGTALAALLKENRMTASSVVFGLPAKWIVASTKESPDASVDATTRNDILRLAAESEFSTELKDLVYDYAHGSGTGPGNTVYLMATQRRNIEAVSAIAKAAKLKIAAIMPTAVALGEVTTRQSGKLNGVTLNTSHNALVLAVNGGNAELTAQQDGTIQAIRQLRATSDKVVSISDLRRAVSMLPGARQSLNGSSGMNGSSAAARRELIIWNAPGLDAESLSNQTGLAVRAGELSRLGVAASQTAGKSAAEEFAPAIALAVIGLRDGSGKSDDAEFAVDFLHSRLAPLATRRIPRWAIIAGVAVVVVVAGCIKLYSDLQHDRQQLQADRVLSDSRLPRVAVEAAFVKDVSFAQGWHGGDPRYLACIRDLTLAIPDDGQTIATQLVLREQKPQGVPVGSAAASAGSRTLSGQLFGKTTGQQNVQTVLARMRDDPSFRSAKLGGTQDIGKGREVTFSINFDYVPIDPQAATKPAAASAVPKRRR